MSRKERDRIGIMVGIPQGQLTLRAAAPVLGLSYRQTKRVWRRYQDQGDAGRGHGRRGRRRPRRQPDALRAAVLALVAQERSADFGPTLLAEPRGRQNLEVAPETVRRWWLAGGK